MEWTSEELRSINDEEFKGAITSVLQKSLVKNGRIDLGELDHAQIDYAIYLLREYKVKTWGASVVDLLRAAS